MANLVPLAITAVVLIAILVIASGVGWWMTRRTPERIKRDLEKNCQVRNKVMYCTNTIPCDSLAMLLKTNSVCMNVEHSERILHVIDHQQGLLAIGTAYYDSQWDHTYVVTRILLEDLRKMGGLPIGEAVLHGTTIASGRFGGPEPLMPKLWVVMRDIK